MSDMKIRATRVTFLFNGDSAQWIATQDLKQWEEKLKKVSTNSRLSGHFDYQLSGLRSTVDGENGGAIKKVVLEIPLPKSEINKLVQDVIFSLQDIVPMRVTVENYTVDPIKFGERNSTNLRGSYVVEADS